MLWQERKFAGGAVEPDEDELHRLDSFFSDINQNAPLEDELKGAQSVIENPSYTQLLTASTFEEIEVYILVSSYRKAANY